MLREKNMVELLEKLLRWWPVSTDLRKENARARVKTLPERSTYAKAQRQDSAGVVEEVPGTSVWEPCGHVQRA